MEIKLSSSMLASIDEHIQNMRGKHDILDVYKTAELIRVAHIHENVAREDIMDNLVLRAGPNFALEFHTPDDESEEVIEAINGSAVEFLLPVDTLKSVH
jgi:hypothetical protein